MGTTRPKRTRTDRPPATTTRRATSALTSGNGWANVLGVKGSQVQILSARPNIADDLRKRRSSFCATRFPRFTAAFARASLHGGALHRSGFRCGRRTQDRVRDVNRGRLTPAWPFNIWQIQPADRPNVLPDPATRTLERIKEATQLGRVGWVSNPLTGRAGSSMDL